MENLENSSVNNLVQSRAGNVVSSTKGVQKEMNPIFGSKNKFMEAFGKKSGKKLNLPKGNPPINK